MTVSFPKAVIVGVQGTVLSQEEKALFKEQNPLGFILFARNIETPSQIKKLCDDLRSSVDREDTPILIDQEGGRVARLRDEDHFPLSKPFKFFGDLYKKSPDEAIEALRLNIELQCSYLKPLGITVNCSPVLDLVFEGAHDIIGDRSFSSDPEIVSILGKVVCETFIEHGITPVVKHLPGHGRALADSHLELPVVDVPRAELLKTDFYPFIEVLKEPYLKEACWGMVAHILYPELDDELPATLSRQVVSSVLRDDLGAGGFLVADDIGMKALDGTVEERTVGTVVSGLDGTLACNHDMDETRRILDAAPMMTEKAWNRFVLAEKHRLAGETSQLDTKDIEKRMKSLALVA